MPKIIQIAVDAIPGNYSQNQVWLGTYYPITDVGKFRTNIALGTTSVVEYTINGGTNWIKINSGVALPAFCSTGFDIYVRAGDFLNLRSPTTGTTVVIMARMDSVKNEG